MNILFGIGKFLRKTTSKDKQLYSVYKSALTKQEQTLNNSSCILFGFAPTSMKSTLKTGIRKETLQSLQTSEFIKKFYDLLAKKGYQSPQEIAFMEEVVPYRSGIEGTSDYFNIFFNPRCIETLDFRVPIHELGHCLHNRITETNSWQRFLSIFKVIKDGHIPILNKGEQTIFYADLQRAWKGGYLKHSHPEANIKNGLVTKNVIKKFRKDPAGSYFRACMQNRYEFCADVFMLSARGFKFSPEIMKKYAEFKGPEIKEIITEAELVELEKIKKQIMKKTLSDYGVSFANV